MLSILYVDDEPGLLEVARLFLENTGEFRVTTSTSAQKALDSPEILSYNAIISDYQMPGMDGIAFLKTVRQRSTDIPFILFTGRGREEVVIEAINNGADFYIQKGGDPKAQFAELTHKIRQAVARRLAECSLLDSERRLSDIINFLPDATFAIDRTGTVIAWNRAMEEMTGTGASDVLGRGNYIYGRAFYGEARPMLIDLVLDCDEQFEQKEYSYTQRDGTTLTAETIRKNHDGTQVYLWGKASRLYDKNGNLTGAIESVRDITERKHLQTDLERKHGELQASYEQLTAAEEELRSQYEELSVTEQRVRESEQRFRGLIQNSSDMIHIIDRNGLTIYSSPSNLRLVGYDPANLIGKDPLDYVHPDDRERVKEALGKVFGKTNPGTPTEYRIRHRDGHYIDVESIASNQLDTPGIDGVVATTRPIAERKKGEILLRERESKFTNVFRSSPVALTLVSATDGTFVDINDTFGKNSGYSRDEVVGRTAEMLGFFTDKSEYGRFISCLRDKRAVQGMELKCRIKNGEIRTCRFSSGIIMMDGIPHILSSVEDFTEHRKAEEALLKSRQQLEDAMELAHLVNWEYDLRSGTLTFDNRFYALCGTSAVREGGSRMSTETYAREFVHPDDRHTVADEMEKASKSTDPDYVSRREHRIVRRDGEIRHVLTLIRLMRATEGRVIKVYGTIQDFTDQKRAEEALRESEERFRGMAERSSDLILILSKEMSPTYVSPSARSIIGYDPEELVGKSPEFAMATIFSQAGPDVMKAAGTIMKGNLVENTELRVRRKDGALIYVNMHAVPVLQEGVLAGVQVSMRDITAGKKAELALLESEEKFRSFVENANEIVFSLTPDGTFTYVSPNWTELLGHDTRDVIGRPAAEYIHPDDFPRNRDFFLQAVTTGKKMSGIEYRIRHKDGTWLWHSQSISPVRDTGGRVITIQGICHDITERRQAEEALRQAQKKLNLLSSITRHDISNQLLVLNGFIGLLHKKIPDPSYEEYFSRITKAGNQILGMIKFTREYEKIGVHTPVWQVLATVVDDAGKGILPGQVSLKTDIHAGTEVFADPLIVKAFFNLLDNSVRHGQRVTEIRVSTHTSGGNLVVVWEDNGVGIAMEEKEQIFERGFGKNTGLGMFLVREILSLTGITITETGEPGTGARFEIVVPDGTWREAGNGRTGEREYQDRY